MAQSQHVAQYISDDESEGVGVGAR